MDKETRLTLEIYRDLLTIDYSQHSQFFAKMMQIVELNLLREILDYDTKRKSQRD